jgi:hypothetical protein
MKFFSNLRKGYAIAKGSKLIPILNLISFYGGILVIVVFPILGTFWEYW